MTRVIADEGLKAKLKDFTEGLEIYNESGKFVGFFRPVPVEDREVYERGKANPSGGAPRNDLGDRT